ncbi:MAG: hypothetical protein KAU60_10245 [Desulfobacterales bacterium]|nr:hypothetical protein [Desulfobacterales bacterium]
MDEKIAAIPWPLLGNNSGKFGRIPRKEFNKPDKIYVCDLSKRPKKMRNA